eukprot:5507555-Heterocapsa_arctica.AAC.1
MSEPRRKGCAGVMELITAPQAAKSDLRQHSEAVIGLLGRLTSPSKAAAEAVRRSPVRALLVLQLALCHQGEGLQWEVANFKCVSPTPGLVPAAWPSVVGVDVVLHNRRTPSTTTAAADERAETRCT